jgi:hypothetical protein
MADGRPGRCGACRFWDGEGWGTAGEVATIGLCRRLPPRPRDDMTGLWPETRPDDWCGEFAPRPDAPPPGADDPRPLAALGLPTRLVNVLRKEDRIYPEPWQPIRTVGELVRRSADELEGLNNFGPGFTAKVRRALAARGLALRGDPPAVDTAPSDKAEYPQRGASPPPGPSR